MYSRIAVLAVPSGDSFEFARTRNFASGGPLQHFPEAVRYRGDTRRNPVVTGRFDLLGEVLLLEAEQLFHDL